MIQQQCYRLIQNTVTIHDFSFQDARLNDFCHTNFFSMSLCNMITSHISIYIYNLQLQVVDFVIEANKSNIPSPYLEKCIRKCIRFQSSVFFVFGRMTLA